MHTNKEPWLAGSLSWLLPGIGHIYSARCGRGICLIILAVLLHVFSIASLISTRTSIFLPILLNLCGIIVLPIYASLDAFRLTRRRNTEDFESERTLGKDPWLAVFLSVVLPGLGHIYIQKRIIGILFLLSFCVLRVISQTNYYALLTVLVLPAVASVHAYGAWQFHKVKMKHPLTLFVIVLLCSGLLKRFLIPLAERQFFVQPYVSLVGPSMEPTLSGRCRVVVDRFTYIWKDPVIGDIVVFTPPDNVSSDHANSKCKRIVAVGGETIQVRDGYIYVDGKEREVRGRTHRQVYSGSSVPINFRGKDNPFLAYGVHEPYHVPEGHYFALGDNHPYSVDSRCFGAIPRENITGKVIKISWPPRRMGLVQ
jgi:signal peptidase I